jgi:hypothetical protein
MIIFKFFCEILHSTNADTNTHTSIHPTLMSASERLTRVNLRFTNSVKERLIIDGDITYH